MTRATDRFNSQIRTFERTRTSGERGGTISKKEMETALDEIGPGRNGKVSQVKLQAAKDLLEGGTKMTRGGREALEGFIAQWEAGGVSGQTASNGRELRKMLEDDPALSRGVFDAAFGRGSRAGYAHKLDRVSKRDDGNFDVDVTRYELVGLGHEKHSTVVVDSAGKAVAGEPVVDRDGPSRRFPRDVIKVRADDPIDVSPVTTATNARDLRKLLEADSGKFDGLRQAAFGQGSRGAYAHALGAVHKRADGNFDVEIERHELAGLGNSTIRTVVADGDGDLVSAPRPRSPGRRPGGRVFKVRADDPIDSVPDPVPPQPAPRRPGGYGGGGGFGGGRVFKITADE